mmetsp:Transcript_11305/g.42355  ORF Transcript_11305/g.42355 Transcript_11305/m.42355 type:complete len:536 (-) Transcript_11305:1505-3112(-)|eukprot:CAMPEP_0117445954 /NCGR_PEP_ID=MMETSP0759-20121206/6075_1 /TAXON_ID=63605 /ORGANISM="Percolomonas cosmopolitus, Strain WS" /LENGTH=535 /DNA_ID=CAMNT_0005238173 /DNA_START=77 /DNA_END=1684 /DNA_ORIENTATION=+
MSSRFTKLLSLLILSILSLHLCNILASESPTNFQQESTPIVIRGNEDDNDLLFPVSSVVPSNTNPGLKVTVNQHAFSYLLDQLLPKLRTVISTIQIPDISASIKTPIGHVDFTLSAMRLGGVSLPSAQLLIQNGGLKASVLQVSLSASGNWHYREHSWPHISDHGSIDVHVGLSSLDLNVQAVLDPSHKSGLRVSMPSAQLHFSSFSIKVHGGASWLYNLIISALKGSIEKSIEKAISEQVPPQVTKQLQSMLDQQDLQVPISNGVFLAFDPREVQFVDNDHVTLGASGEFIKKDVPPCPGDPSSTPDTVNNKMVQIFITDHVLTSAGWTFDKAQLMQTLVTQHDIPASWPVQLNTSYLPFKFAVPGLYAKYPDMGMQILFGTDQDVTPKATMSEESGIDVVAIGTGVFKVVQPDGGIVDAFTLDLKLDLAIKAHVQDNVISGEVSLKNLTLGVKQSQVGDIQVSGLNDSVNFLVSNILVPIINAFATKGFPIPQLSDVNLVDPQLYVKDGHLEVYSDFTYSPDAHRPQLCGEER